MVQVQNELGFSVNSPSMLLSVHLSIIAMESKALCCYESLKYRRSTLRQKETCQHQCRRRPTLFVCALGLTGTEIVGQWSLIELRISRAPVESSGHINPCPMGFNKLSRHLMGAVWGLSFVLTTLLPITLGVCPLYLQSVFLYPPFPDLLMPLSLGVSTLTDLVSQPTCVNDVSLAVWTCLYCYDPL